ncbi:GGDEF domain-containing protein [Methylobacterium oxalidis]|uniref:diguanylate cyclase n=1 Tax=Methylobacterium oxalidis TaxID=944322 RepID=A0A512IY16_9HYPH|nr:GGDEF domain-containing protein [Methylobacterium oxalidis]GEP02617.1 GGDEF domain-containing protein [Methylobacterium oxalidis]GJE30051.1 hypothetical protein LDDCCGHA_0214 [Methylobacterium oxalidis]GLS61826.1 GGDEF domain-containing protein [Methylobacterium oxalidis]
MLDFDRLLPALRIRSGQHVLAWTAAATAISVAAPVCALAVALSAIDFGPVQFWGILAVCAAIPLLIAPPVALFLLSMMRLITITVERIDHYVQFDTLTGVLTRAYLLGRIRGALPSGGAFLMVDADHFKAINDTYGHDVGDEALKRIAEVLRATTHAESFVGRLGGEEFGVFLPGADDARAAAVASALCAAMRASGEVVAGHPLHLTISIGGASHLRTDPLERTMKLADAALYRAKRNGRDRFYIAAATDTMPALILQSDAAPAP